MFSAIRATRLRPLRHGSDVAPDVQRNGDDARGQMTLLLLDDANPIATDMQREVACAEHRQSTWPQRPCRVAFVADAGAAGFTRDRAPAAVVAS
jgi:hypothetical protein